MGNAILTPSPNPAERRPDPALLSLFSIVIVYAIVAALYSSV
jgi:hypothetical protein